MVHTVDDTTAQGGREAAPTLGQHTPGPWAVITEARDTRITSSDAHCITRLPQWPELQAEATANARLIAAAPDLLEALQEILAAAQHNDPSRWVARSLGLHVLAIADAAIKKATTP